MNFITKTISTNHKVISNAKIRHNWSSLKDLPGSSIRFFHLPVSSKANDEEIDAKANHKLHVTKSALFSSLNMSQSLICPAYGRNVCIRNNSTIRFKSTVPGVDEASSSPSAERAKSQLQNNSGSSVDSSDSLSNSQKAKQVAKTSVTSMRGIIKKYGWTFIGTYLGVYFATLGTLFVSIDSGLIDPMTITSIELPWHSSGGAEESMSADKDDFDSGVEFISSYMKKFPWTAPYADIALKNPHMTNLALAWIAVKFTEPIRLPLSLGIVRKIAKDKES